MKRASFVSIEDEGVDLILSFALEDDALVVTSLILMRTPKFEPLLPEYERGARVSLEGETPCEEDDFLVLVVLSGENIEITTQSRIYRVDLSKVDEAEIKTMKPLLHKMNFDNKFEIRHV